MYLVEISFEEAGGEDFEEVDLPEEDTESSEAEAEEAIEEAGRGEALGVVLLFLFISSIAWIITLYLLKFS